MRRESAERRTRRDVIRRGGSAVIGAGLLAGCTDGSSSEGGGADDTTSSGPTKTTTAATDTTNSGATGTQTTASPESYTITPKPYDSITFDAVPKTYATTGGAWTDIGFAFGSEPAAMSRIEPYPTRYYDLLPGVTFEASGITDLGDPSEYNKEQFYGLDVDALLIDRILVASYARWQAADFEEIGKNVAPFCGTYIRNEWAGEALGMDFSFPYYTLTEAVSLSGDLFGDRKRADAWVSLHETFRSDLQSRAPSQSPSIGLLYSASNPAQGEFMVTDPTLEGVATRQYRTFGVENAFADIDLTDGWKTDYEGVLEADPEYFFFDSTLSMSRKQFERQFITPLKESAVGSELTAVKQGNVFRGGGRYQGPIINLFVSEILAKQLYPEQFGTFTAVGEIPEGERLFDRKRAAAIINGNV